MYAPNVDGLLWNHATNHTFLPPRQTHPGPPDHIGLELVLNVATGTRGKDLPRINASIYDDPVTHARIAACIDEHFPPDGPYPSDTCVAWTTCKAQLRSISLTRTKESRLQDTKHAAELKLKISQATATIVDGSAS